MFIEIARKNKIDKKRKVTEKKSEAQAEAKFFYFKEFIPQALARVKKIYLLWLFFFFVKFFVYIDVWHFFALLALYKSNFFHLVLFFSLLVRFPLFSFKIIFPQTIMYE